VSKQAGKPVELLQVSDLEANPVWEFVNDDSGDETEVHPVVDLPAQTLAGKVVGTQVRLANGDHRWAFLGNIDADDPRATEHFVTLSVEHRGKWLHLARYHDIDYATRGPDTFAHSLSLGADEVFPIFYDVRRYARGNPCALVGRILKEPREQLSRAELIAMALR
jgi:hypothetical protein